MPKFVQALCWPATLVVAVALIGLFNTTGCGGGGNTWEFIGTPFTSTGGSTAPTGPANAGQTSSGTLGGVDRTPVDPCTESQARKFVTISMRNLGPDFIHYFFVAVAFEQVDSTSASGIIPAFDGTPFPNGAVCETDVQLYLRFGYVEIPSGTQLAFGDYCIRGPALFYFHRNGQFRRSAGTGSTGLGSAIAPAQGTSATFDGFFTSAGAQVPVPDLILFHNPGTGEGAHLKISRQTTAPCDLLVATGTPPCLRDAFYYVDDTDIMVGSPTLGLGSGRRVPAEIQGTGCQGGTDQAYQILAPSHVTSTAAHDNEFLRGGRIEFVFLRDDETPQFPQLVWKATDSAGGVAHPFDPRAGVP